MDGGLVVGPQRGSEITCGVRRLITPNMLFPREKLFY